MRCIVTDGFCDFLNLSSNISTKVFALSHLSLEFRVQLTRKIKLTFIIFAMAIREIVLFDKVGINQG